MTAINLNFDALIRNLGSSYDELLEKKMIPEIPPEQLYEDEDSLEMEPVAGVELVFKAKNLCLESIYITLKETNLGQCETFEGVLPEPFNQAMTQLQVRSEFGKPTMFDGPRKAPGLEGTLGAWEIYPLDEKYHHAAQVEFQYDENRRVTTMVFSLVDRHM